MNPNLFFVGLILVLILIALLRVALPVEKIGSAIGKLLRPVEEKIGPHVRWIGPLWQNIPIKVALDFCALGSILLLIFMLGPVELNWPVELRVWLMPLVYGFAAYGLAGLLLIVANNCFHIEASILEEDREYVKRQWAAAAQKTRLYAGVIVLGIAFIASKDHDKDAIDATSARYHAGETKWVLGKVYQIKRIRDGKVLVDFGDVYPKQSFTAVFTPEAFREVRQERGEIKVGDWVSVHGIIDLYDGRPEIRVYDEWDVDVNPDSPDGSD